MYLIRKIDEALWLGKEELDAVSIKDVISGDNDISVWKDDDQHSLKLDLALAFLLTQSTFTDLCFIYIPESDLDKYDLKYEQQDASTPYEAMKSYHYNIKIPTFFEVGFLAELINRLFSSGTTNIEHIDRPTLQEYFYNAVVADKIYIDFSDNKKRAFADTLRSMEKQKGKIDFTKLTNAKPYKNGQAPKKISNLCDKCNEYKTALKEYNEGKK